MSPKNLPASWAVPLEPVIQSDQMLDLKSFLSQRHAQQKIIYPPPQLWFEALNQTPLDQVKAVILGQDPYHQPNQAHGLAFSVRQGIPMPPSLRNIFQELHADLQIRRTSTDLSGWARQGVLLLNAVLSVEHGDAGSHANKGWENFTDTVIKTVSQEQDHVVFILWGAYAQKKIGYIDAQKHLILKSVHPSPLSASRGFFGSKPFSKTNQFLLDYDIDPIDWSDENPA